MACSHTQDCQDRHSVHLLLGAHLSLLATAPTASYPAPLMCLSPMVISAELSKSNIHAPADLLVLFVYKNRPYITPAAASSRYVDRALCLEFPLDRTWAMNKAPTYLIST